MIDTPEYNVCSALLDQGVLHAIDADSVAAFLAGDGLRVLFFSGPNAVRRESHDVAVALRELLKHYDGDVIAGHVSDEATPLLQESFRVTATPCLVFVVSGEVIEVMPRVRDWAEYAAAFSRYLGQRTAKPTSSGAL